ncbi:unnamed protein product [Urochloa decumbens]|uniref:Uncharacterized protein n=1 Tax=Urochloa decumbens TaxID=240449 RepID=A0ABC9B5V0_9POAL
MALLAVCSKKARVFLVAVALLVALLAAVASAGRGDLPMALDGQCSRVGACSDSLCTEMCSVHDVGSCQFQGLFVYCCYRPVHSTTSGDAQPRLLGH